MKAYRVLPERIWQLMGDQTMTATELAEESGVPKETLSRILNSHVPSPQKRTLRKIADALDVEVKDITEPTHRPLMMA